MSSLRSALEELQGEDLFHVDDRTLETDVVELERAARLLHAERMRRLAEVDRRGQFRRDGALSMSAWVASRTGIGWNAATAEVRTARALKEMPATSGALGSARVSIQAMRMLVRARETHPDDFHRDEEVLVDAARRLKPRDLFHALEYWKQAIDESGTVEEAELRYQRRFLHISRTLHGMVRMDGEFDAETGESVITALRAVQDAQVRGSDGPDLRSAAQRRADALGELSRQWLDSSTRPKVAGERPHVNVVVDVEALAGDRGARAAFAGGLPLHPDAARRVACDAAISRVLTTGRSEPLDVGRRTPVVSPVIRRALIVRDRHCTFPGCERPEEWCDAHHIVHWADGGPTSLSNLILLCRPHHRTLHDRDGIRAEMVDGAPRFTRPDGTPLLEPAPP